MQHVRFGAPTSTWLRTCWANVKPGKHGSGKCPRYVDPDPESIGLCEDHLETLRKWSR